MRKVSAIAGFIGIVAVTVALAAETVTEAARSGQPAAPSKPTGPAVALPMEPIHNTFKLGKKIISGSCPYGDAGFKVLANQGVKTVISVDGARPDEAIAKKYGMRYVHIPITYSGITRDQSLSVARAVRDLEGLVFIHCHHGKHRGPTAAVIATMVADGWTVEQAQLAMKQAGTAPSYTGLWAAVCEWKAPTKEELDKADATFPAAAAIPATAASMVTIDERWEHMGKVRAAGWKVPVDHPDIDPPHEATLLREDFRELARHPESAKNPADYMRKLADAEAAATALEAALRGQDIPKARESFKAIELACKSCHTAYRDNNPAAPKGK